MVYSDSVTDSVTSELGTGLLRSVPRMSVPGTDGMSAAAVRAALELSVDQLGDLTVQLDLQVGPRRNYPVYGPGELRQLAAVCRLRQVRAPLSDVAVRAVRDYAPAVRAGSGWLVAVPGTGESWVCAHLLSPADLVGQIGLAGAGLLLDLAHTAAAADRLYTARLR